MYWLVAIVDTMFIIVEIFKVAYHPAQFALCLNLFDVIYTYNLFVMTLLIFSKYKDCRAICRYYLLVEPIQIPTIRHQQVVRL